MIVADLQPFRLERARQLGGVGVVCAIECVGHYHEAPGREAPLAKVVKMIRTAGRIVTRGLGEHYFSITGR